MTAYRLTHSRYARDMSGFGAYKAGGRWNPRGYYALYLSEHPCGAILETLIHLPAQLIPDDFSLIRYRISNKAPIRQIKDTELPESWRQKDYRLSEFQEYGRINLFEKKILGMRIPSFVAYPSHNFILNPNHPKFAKNVHIVDIQPYIFDPRLIGLFQTAH